LTGRKRQGLRRPSPDLISKAIDDTTAQVIRIGLTFLGTAAFCFLSLFSPDSALLGGSEKISVPLAGPVSFFGFMLVGPAILIMLRVYLQIYVEHSDRLERLRRSMLPVWAPTLVPLKNPLIRVLGGVTFYLVLPIAMMLFAWKAAVFPAWGSGLLCVAAGAITSHAMLPIRKVSKETKVLLSVSAPIVALFLILGLGPLSRSFDLERANLSDHWLQGENLMHAYLMNANLTRAHLSGARLRGAPMARAKLTGADLILTELIRADLREANLTDTDLRGADLRGADLRGANLSGANLIPIYLSGAHPRGADLRGADLRGANLNNTNLSGADLRGADLRGANLNNTSLSGADLSGADLSDAHQFMPRNLNEACGNENTKLPEGYTVKPCPVERKGN